jgi:predicted nucleic acid-binding Zn ribbon protein
VSVAAPAVSGAQAEAQKQPCPLCGTPLEPEQSWCLRCGAAARTRLAAPAKWKALVIALLIVAVLSLGVLAAALVKLAG